MTMKSTINVCVVNPDYYRSSGVTIAIKRIFQSASNDGTNFFFVDCGCKVDLQDILWIPEGKLSRFDLMTRNPIRLLSEVVKFHSWARKINIQVIHVHHRRLAIIFNIFKYFFGGNVLYSANLTYKFSLLFWLFSPRNIIAITKSVAENVKSTTRWNPINTIGNPTWFPNAVPDNISQADRTTAICVARFDLVKGHRNLIDAWHTLKIKGLNFHLMLVGEGSLQEQVQEQVDQLGLSDLVSFHGYTTEVNSLYKQSLFSILVSEVEGQGIVTIESAAAARASLLTDVDGSRDCLPPNRKLVNGLKFGDVTALSTALEYWFSHPAEVLDEGCTFFEYHQTLNSFEAIGEQYSNVYRRFLSQ